VKLILCIVHDADAPRVTEALVDAGHRVTRMASMGGFLRRGNSTLFIGTEDEQVDEVLGLIRASTQPHEEPLRRPDLGTSHIGAAVVFVLDLGSFERIVPAAEQ
jgi:uncharacterized protein YaaQ